MRNAKKIWLALLLLGLSAFLFSGDVLANVNVNVVIANPSAEKAQKVTVNYELPPGLRREDIVDTGELDASYDVAGSRFYLTGEVELNPKETRTLKVTIRDIWKIPSEKFTNIAAMLEGKIKALGEDISPEELKPVSDEIMARLEDVQKFQRDNEGDIQRRMESFTSNVEKLRRIENDIFSLERLVKKEADEARGDETVVLTIEARSPFDEEKELPVRYELPREITPQHIEETGRMEIMHDVTANIFYLFSEETFSPGETKRYQVRIKNVWKIPESEINGYVNEAVEIHSRFVDLPEEETAAMLLRSIRENASRVLDSQGAAESVRDRVAAFRANQMILREIKDDLERMRSLATPEASTAYPELRAVLQADKIFEMIKQLSDKLFKAKLTAATVWRIIMIVVSFAIVLTSIFYALWIVKLKKDESRSYDKMG
jgi:hypothetical protein